MEEDVRSREELQEEIKKLKELLQKLWSEKSGLQRAEDELKKSEERYRNLIDFSPDGIFVQSENRFVYVNEAGVKLIGLKSPEELIGKSTAEFVLPTSYDNIKKRLRELDSSGNIGPYLEERFIRNDGQVIDVEIAALNITYQGRPGTHVVVRDVTKRKEAERTLQQYAKELEEANRLKDLFTDIMSHDLLNPINTIYGVFDLITEEAKDTEDNKFYEIIYRNLDRASELIADATKFSRIEDAESIELEDIDLKDIIDDVVEIFIPMATQSDMEIVNRIDQKIMIKGSKLIEEVFSNFISNAIKYAPGGEKIVIDTMETEDSYQIGVIDFGEGISDKYKVDIFERFHRRKKEGVKGSGIGLAIVKRIIDLHNGKTWVEDNPEGGSIFYVSLPKK